MTLKKLILDDFEHNDLTKYNTNHSFVKSYDLSFSNEHSKYGKTSLKLTYNFGGWLSGNAAMPVKFNEKLSTLIMPKKIAIWIYADGKVPWLRATIIDGLDERKTVNLTDESLEWQGWKYLEGSINSSWGLPLRVEQIYAVETDKQYQGIAEYRGFMFFDHLQFVYRDDEDLIGPVFSNTYPKKTHVYQDIFNFHTMLTDEVSGVDPNSIVMKVNNKKVNFYYCHEKNQVRYLFRNVKEGVYQLEIQARDFAGNKAVPHFNRSLFVDLSPDIEKPILSQVTPTELTTVYMNRPRITFNLIDEKSGIDEASISLKINHIEQDLEYDAETGWGYVISKEQLPDGDHTFTISATDQAGNKLNPIKYNFAVKSIEQPKDKTALKISVIPDTHSEDYTSLAFLMARHEETPFIIQMGDMVDQATKEEFNSLQKNVMKLNDKPILTVPGNHESFQGNLEKHFKLFGPPTYHLIYGNTLFVFLNTAYEQSISISDSTQFHYLEHLLLENKQENIVIITHVPTKDRFGTSHEMIKADADRLERILGDYKQATRSTDIMVLFGHLHIVDQWNVRGVNYIITGNAANKGYLSHDQGNILGQGILHISVEGLTYQFLPYIEHIIITANDTKIHELSLRIGKVIFLRAIIEVNKLSSRYTVDATDMALLHIKWSSTNKEIVNINNNGELKSLKEGKAIISVEISKVKHRIKVIVGN